MAALPDTPKLCARCPHPFNDHELRSAMDPPIAGWMVCPVEGCDCWSTWSASHPDMPAAMQAQIDQELACIRALRDQLGQDPSSMKGSRPAAMILDEVSSERMYDAARMATDDVFGPGTYAQMHAENPDPAIKRAVGRARLEDALAQPMHDYDEDGKVIPPDFTERCPTCGGTGIDPKASRRPYRYTTGGHDEPPPCPDCNGEG